MLEKLYKKDALMKQFALLVFLQPFIDIYRLFLGNTIEIAGISLVELINIILIIYLAILFILNQRKWKTFAPAILYSIILVIYLFFHCYNMLQFDTNIITGTSINVIVECYVIIRAYVLPIMVLYMLLYIRTTEECFLKTIVGASSFISCVIVVTNLLKVSYISYASNLEKNEMIHQNIIEWFTKNPPMDLNLITSKGWFYSGNQIGLILLMLFPIVIYYAIKNNRKRTYLLIVIQVVAMIMVATKTAALGSIVVMVIMIGLLILFGILYKKWKEYLKKAFVIAIILCCSILLVQVSPVKKMIGLQELSYISGQEEELKSELEDFSSGELDTDEFSKFMYKYYYIYGIQEEYVKLFPVEKYPEFWLSVISDENKSQANFRKFKKRIYTEVEKENANPKDEYLGIGYTTNFPYLEKDIIAQNVWFGKIGTILLIGPFLIIFIIASVKILLNMKKKFNMFNCILGLSICGGLGASLLAGHLFGYFFPILIFAYIVAQLFQEVGTDNKDVKKNK